MRKRDVVRATAVLLGWLVVGAAPRTGSAQNCLDAGDGTVTVSEADGARALRAATRHFRASIAPGLPRGWGRRVRTSEHGMRWLRPDEARACLGLLEDHPVSLARVRPAARVIWVRIEPFHAADGEHDYIVFLDDRWRVVRTVPYPNFEP